MIRYIDDSERRRQRFEGLYRTDGDRSLVKSLSLMEVSGENLKPMGFFVDRDAAGASVGYKIAGFRYHPGLGQPLSKYVYIGNKMLCDLDVVSVGKLPPNELRVANTASAMYADSLLDAGRFFDALDLLKGITIPSLEKLEEVGEIPKQHYSIAAPKVRETARRMNIPLTDNMDRVLRQLDVDSAKNMINNLDPTENSVLLGALLFRMREEVQGADFSKVMIHSLERFARLSGMV